MEDAVCSGSCCGALCTGKEDLIIKYKRPIVKAKVTYN
jgi:hypothetical protein